MPQLSVEKLSMLEGDIDTVPVVPRLAVMFLHNAIGNSLSVIWMGMLQEFVAQALVAVAVTV
jgi:hypothetical protein